MLQANKNSNHHKLWLHFSQLIKINLFRFLTKRSRSSIQNKKEVWAIQKHFWVGTFINCCLIMTQLFQKMCLIIKTVIFNQNSTEPNLNLKQDQQQSKYLNHQDLNPHLSKSWYKQGNKCTKRQCFTKKICSCKKEPPNKNSQKFRGGHQRSRLWLLQS